MIVGNPPYSVGQGSSNDNAANLSYPKARCADRRHVCGSVDGDAEEQPLRQLRPGLPLGLRSRSRPRGRWRRRVRLERGLPRFEYVGRTPFDSRVGVPPSLRVQPAWERADVRRAAAKGEGQCLRLRKPSDGRGADRGQGTGAGAGVRSPASLSRYRGLPDSRGEALGAGCCGVIPRTHWMLSTGRRSSPTSTGTGSPNARSASTSFRRSTTRTTRTRSSSCGPMDSRPTATLGTTTALARSSKPTRSGWWSSSMPK